MSSGNRNSEQAGRLLRAIGEIDDRFLMEAMTPEEMEKNLGETHTDPDRTLSADRPASVQDKDKKTTPGRRRLRRYSAWALTAAACLTVVVIGRFVSVNQVTGEKEQPAAIVKEAQSEQPSLDLEDTAAEAPVAGQVKEAVPEAGSAEADMEIRGASDSGALEATYNAAMEAEDSAAPEAAGSAEAQASDNAAMEMEDSSAGLQDGASGAAGAGALLTMPNPFVDTQTLEEACAKAGFLLALPEEEEPCEKIYRVIPDQMIEVICLGEDSRELLRIRKGKDMPEDISGVYEEYAASEILDPDGLKIAVSGDRKDRWEVACWTQKAEDGSLYAYSITTDRDPLTGEEVVRMAGEMMAES